MIKITYNNNYKHIDISTLNMCGISGMLIKSGISKDQLANLQLKFYESSKKISHRGPDRSHTITMGNPVNIMIDFERLSIMDTSTRGDQPFKFEEGDRTVYVMCNGEIYNFHNIIEEFKLSPKSGSDCETIPLMYQNKIPVKQIMQKLNSEHSCVILDINTKTGDYELYLGTDRFGIRPLFIAWDEFGFYWSSELIGLPCIDNNDAHIERFHPRHIGYISKNNNKISEISYIKYYSFDSNFTYIPNSTKIMELLTNAVIMRLESDRPYGCLLSGGADSSLVSAIASKHLKTMGKKLKTFSIGMPNGTDEKFAKMVADYIDSDHTHIMVSEKDFINAIPDIVKTIGSYDITSVRASTGQYLISKWISENTDIKVLLCGDGADEVAGGYKYFHNAPSPQEFHNECIRLLEDIHCYDGLRADRCISHFGIEARFPFLDYKFVEYYLGCDPKYRQPKNGLEKWLIRNSFDGTNLLPHEVLFRHKEAFSDGVSSIKKSWYKIIQENVEKQYDDYELDFAKTKYSYHLAPLTKEALWYRELFESYYGKNKSVAKTIPYFWLPKWCGNITDPSARVLEIYEASK